MPEFPTITYSSTSSESTTISTVITEIQSTHGDGWSGNIITTTTRTVEHINNFDPLPFVVFGVLAAVLIIIALYRRRKK